MNSTTTATRPNRMFLHAETAADLMTASPISVSEGAKLKDAIAFLSDKGFSAAPVVNQAGRAVGVLSQTDIVIHDRNKSGLLPSATEFYAKTDLVAPTGESLLEGYPEERVETMLVRDVMTPMVLSVTPTDSVSRVVSDMLNYKVHRLFVIEAGILVGVISAFDVLRALRGEKGAPNAKEVM